MRVRQIVGNLLGNALKFTPEGGTITIAARGLPESDEVQITVSDSGTGIHPRELPHLFERYWQARLGGAGAGLGLSIVKALVEAHSGRVAVASEPGNGTSLSFTLPAKQPFASASAAPIVLVVDDDPEVRLSVAEVLEEAGYRTLTAGDGIEALELLRQKPQLCPSVILLDLEMPIMDARAFRQEQKHDPLLKDIAVIVFSAHEDVASIAEQLQVTGHLQKPLALKDLLDAVGQFASPIPKSEPLASQLQ
jgi:two-component system CheB/CheR fusion protein